MMRREWKLAIIFLFFIIAYFLGIWLPIDFLKPTLTNDPISPGDYYRLVVSIISAFITFTAVLVALFKDDLREYWKYAKICFNAPSEITIEVTDDLGESQSDDLIQAKKYVSRIEVHNKGNLPTMNAEVYLDKLEFIPTDSSISQFIEITGAPLKWNGANSSTIIIPPGGRKLIKVVELIAPEKMSLPDSAKESKPPRLIIGDIENKNENKGKWKAVFTLYAQNHRAKSFEVNVEWNGLWKNRLTEMNNYLKIQKNQ